MGGPPPTFEEYEPVPNRTATRNEQRQDVTTSGTATSTAVNAAQLPYAGDTAQAQLTSLLLRNEDLQRQLEKARKGEPLGSEDKTRLITDVDAYEKLMSAIQKFDPNYVGTVFDLPGEIETGIQKRVNSDFGTPGQADFWAQMKFLDMLTRNKYFGASLSGNEKASYAETTITPGVTSETALANLKRRAETVRTGIQRNVSSLMEGGYRPAQINAQLGTYLPELNPRWMSASNERTLGDYASREDFNPAVYKQMLLEFGDANGVRLDPAAAEASANAVAQKRAEGTTSFGGNAVYGDLTAPKEENNDEAALLKANGQGPTDDGDGLGWAETLGSALVNLPRSTADEVGGIFDAITSPIQTVKSVGSLGGALLSKLGVADFDESSADALGQYYANKYGSLEGFKKELANNPASILADVATVLTAGAGTVTKLGLPAKIAKLGNKAVLAQKYAGMVARNIDPITAMTNIVAKAVPAAIKVTGKGAGAVTRTVLGATSGVGGDAIRTAANVGFDRSVVGATTSASDAFLTAMRNPAASADEVVQLARDAIGNLRTQASQRYTDTMARFGRNPVPLDISNVRQRIANIKPDSYDTWKDSQGPRPSSHRAWETMNQFVDEYAYKASQDPSLLTPLAVDQFKQDLYDVGSKIGGAYDRDAARIAGTAYSAVKDELVKHDPVYADAMKDYELAAIEAQQLESTFSLAASRGKQPNIESAGRKLSASLRNNVNTNYGTRTAQVERLAELDPSGRLLPSLAGQTLNTPLPRGLQGGAAGLISSSGLAGIGLNMVPMAMDVPGYLSGANLMMLPAMSPRLVGEAAYYGGRGAGAVSKALEPVTSRFGTAIDRLADMQTKYRDPLVYSGFGAQNIAAMQDPDLQALAQQYAETPPPSEEERPAPAMAMPAPAEQAEVAPAIPKKSRIMFEGREVEYDPETNTYLELASGRRVRELTELTERAQGMYRGGRVQRFNGGGQADAGYDYGNAARTFLGGLTFDSADEIEAAVRALAAQRNLSLDDLSARYHGTVNNVRAGQEGYAEANPVTATGLELAGILGSSLLVPGGAAANTARVATRAAPRLAKVAMANPKKAKLAGEFAKDAALGALYAAGTAPTISDIPRQIRDDALINALFFAGGEGIGAGGRRLGRTAPVQSAVNFVAKRIRR